MAGFDLALAFARAALELFGEALAPSACAGCDAPVAARVLLCPACAATVERAPARSPSAPSHAAFVYGGAIASALARMKYGGRSELAPRLGRALAACTVGLAGAVDVVVPVPIHASRLSSRGFDHASLVAAPVARALGCPLAPRALRRIRDTPAQVGLTRAARLVNVADAFACPSPRPVAGRRVLLVDDVTTTGATLTACGAALRAAGATSLVTAVVATRADLSS